MLNPKVLIMVNKMSKGAEDIILTVLKDRAGKVRLSLYGLNLEKMPQDIQEFLSQGAVGEEVVIYQRRK